MIERHLNTSLMEINWSKGASSASVIVLVNLRNYINAVQYKDAQMEKETKRFIFKIIEFFSIIL
jgi:hypothetical protein